MIGDTAAFVEERFGAEIVYGDTDSVFIRFPGKTLDEADTLARECESVINKPGGPFAPPNYLEYEKIYEPFFLIQKKRYAGLKYSPGHEKPGVLSASGLELVRRDNAPCTPMIQEAFLQSLIVQRKKEQAIREYRASIVGLASRPLHEFTMTRKLSKAQYKTPQIHAELNKKIMARSPGKGHKLGDRVPYVVVRGGGKLYTRGECPHWLTEQAAALESVPSLDIVFYRDRVMRAMDRLLEPLVGFKALTLFNERMINPNKQMMLTAAGASGEAWYPPLRTARRGDTDTAEAVKQEKRESKKRKKVKDEVSERRQKPLTAFFKKQ